MKMFMGIVLDSPPLVFEDLLPLYLPSHIHDGDAVCTVAHHNLVGVLGHQMNAVNVNVASGGRAAQRFKSVHAFAGFGVPDLYGSV